MSEAAAAQEETEMTDHDLLIQVIMIAFGLGEFGEKIIQCIQDLGRGDLVDAARETQALMDMAESAPEEPDTEPPPAEAAPILPLPTEEKPTDGA